MRHSEAVPKPVNVPHIFERALLQECASKHEGDVIVSAETLGALTFESMLTDPLIRAVMDSDGVTVDDLVAVLEAAQRAVEAREQGEPRIIAA
jgi:hypothetical protein